MSTALQRPAVDVAPPRGRPALALLLAILSVPGTTMAWDLSVPLAGLWIGGPLGVAAIVLGLRARRERRSRAASVMAVTAIVVATLALGQMVIWTAVSAIG
jgi:hypothetical protein